MRIIQTTCLSIAISNERSLCIVDILSNTKVRYRP